MNIHEYQGKELFDKFGVPAPAGQAAETAHEAFEAAEKLAADKLVIKSQIHAGGRGKGTFKNGFRGGVHVCGSPGEAEDLAGHMLGNVLVTKQTGPEGKKVRKVFVAEAVDIAHEYYFAILMDRGIAQPVVVASAEGGVEIEEVAEESPEKIFRLPVDPLQGLQGFQARRLAQQLGFQGKLLGEAAKVFLRVYKLFAACDCSMVEINPLVLTRDDRVMALDAKFGFDENALFRHPDIEAMRDPEEEDPREVEADKHKLNYVGLDGNIGCMVNGAGLAMSTMDIIKHHGGEPANFLDVGGGASAEQVTAAFRILLSDENVQAILVNIFGGIMRCDVIASGVIEAAKTLDLHVPVVVRLEGTNVKEGREMLEQSGLKLTTATDLSDAAEKAVRAAKEEG
jgi:succinyl-CoA synthetase beta subunit